MLGVAICGALFFSIYLDIEVIWETKRKNAFNAIQQKTRRGRNANKKKREWNKINT